VKKFKALIFDLFYTLINPLAPENMAENEYRVLDMSREDFEGRNAVDYEVRAGGTIRDPYEMMTHILRGLDIPEEKIREAAEARLHRIRRGLFGVDEKNLALLRRFRERGLKTALVSNADIADIWYWKDCLLSGSFDQTIFSCDAGLLKPDPRIYRLAVDGLGLSPELCLYVGDGGHRELRGAREAGLATVLTTEYIADLWPEKIPELKTDADYVIHRLEDLEDIMGRGIRPHCE
jgi:putative hydrolase of the HAD superfamily